MFRITSLDPSELNLSAARLVQVDADPGFPCRVSLQDAAIGETVYAFSYTHHQVDSPYRSSGPIFVRVGAEQSEISVGEIPPMLEHRRLSLRAYDEGAMMVGAEVVEPGGLRAAIEGLLTRNEIVYLHIHNAGPGCFNCAVARS